MSDETEKPPTDDELREAAALAHALEGSLAAGSAPPPDALEAAALLSGSSRSMQLDPARSAAILAELQSRVRPPARRPRWVRVAVGAAGMAAAAMLAFVVPQRGMAPPAPHPLPRAPAELLSAQLASIRNPGVGAADLDRELHAYRETLYAALERQHGGRR